MMLVTVIALAVWSTVNGAVSYSLWRRRREHRRPVYVIHAGRRRWWDGIP